MSKGCEATGLQAKALKSTADTSASTDATSRAGSRITQQRREHILQTARDLMSEEGAGAVTVRGVARAAGITPGHLGYYFPTLDALHNALLDYVIAPYLETFERLRGQSKEDPVSGLTAVLDYVFTDLASRETTMFFPALWVLANHDDSASMRMKELYDKYMHVLEELISEMRPDLSDESIAQLALFICTSIEGQTVFIGFERPYAQHREALKKIAIDSMLESIRRFEG